MTQPNVLDVYDHEVKAILVLQAELTRQAQEKRYNYGDFEREVRGRFAALGFTVDISWYRYSIDGIEQEGALPEVTITGRTEKTAWDPDRQVHEAVHDVLGLGEEGWIKTDPDTLKRFLGDQGHGRGHSH